MFVCDWVRTQSWVVRVTEVNKPIPSTLDHSLQTWITLQNTFPFTIQSGACAHIYTISFFFRNVQLEWKPLQHCMFQHYISSLNSRVRVYHTPFTFPLALPVWPTLFLGWCTCTAFSFLQGISCTPYSFHQSLVVTALLFALGINCTPFFSLCVYLTDPVHLCKYGSRFCITVQGYYQVAYVTVLGWSFCLFLHYCLSAVLIAVIYTLQSLTLTAPPLIQPLLQQGSEGGLLKVRPTYRCVQVCIVYDQQTQRLRGFTFVYFENIEDSQEVSFNFCENNQTNTTGPALYKLHNDTKLIINTGRLWFAWYTRAKERANSMELDVRRIRVDFSITKRPHTPGIYIVSMWGAQVSQVPVMGVVNSECVLQWRSQSQLAVWLLW